MPPVRETRARNLTANENLRTEIQRKSEKKARWVVRREKKPGWRNKGPR